MKSENRLSRLVVSALLTAPIAAQFGCSASIPCDAFVADGQSLNFYRFGQETPQSIQAGNITRIVSLSCNRDDVLLIVHPDGRMESIRHPWSGVGELLDCKTLCACWSTLGTQIAVLRRPEDESVAIPIEIGSPEAGWRRVGVLSPVDDNEREGMRRELEFGEFCLSWSANDRYLVASRNGGKPSGAGPAIVIDVITGDSTRISASSGFRFISDDEMVSQKPGDYGATAFLQRWRIALNLRCELEDDHWRRDAVILSTDPVRGLIANVDLQGSFLLLQAYRKEGPLVVINRDGLLSGSICKSGNVYEIVSFRPSGNELGIRRTTQGGLPPSRPELTPPRRD